MNKPTLKGCCALVAAGLAQTGTLTMKEGAPNGSAQGSNATIRIHKTYEVSDL